MGVFRVLLAVFSVVGGNPLIMSMQCHASLTSNDVLLSLKVTWL